MSKKKVLAKAKPSPGAAGYDHFFCLDQCPRPRAQNVRLPSPGRLVTWILAWGSSSTVSALVRSWLRMVFAMKKALRIVAAQKPCWKEPDARRIKPELATCRLPG